MSDIGSLAKSVKVGDRNSGLSAASGISDTGSAGGTGRGKHVMSVRVPLLLP